jgi:hypothetical protein
VIPLAPGPATLEAVKLPSLDRVVEFIAAVVAITGYSGRDLVRLALKRRPTSAPKHAAVAVYATKSYADLARKARAACWRIERAGSHHVAWISPTGTRVFAPSTPRGGPSPSFLATLRRAGLDLAA